MKSVKSSQIKSVGYDQDSSTLYVEFSNGVIYQYYGISPDRHYLMMGAESIGKYFRDKIRDMPDQLYSKTGYYVYDGELKSK